MSIVAGEDSSIKSPPKFGLALGGGGARGLAHIGVLKVLEDAGIRVHCLAGTSMGGVIAAGYATGMTADELEQEAKDTAQVRKMVRLADPGLPNAGLMRGRRLQQYFESRLGDRTFDDLVYRLALVAVDLNSRKEVILRNGSLSRALRATTAVPGLFAPVEFDGYRMVDGALLNNVPVDAVRELGADVVLAVDVQPPPGQGNRNFLEDVRWIPSGVAATFATLDQAVTIMLERMQEDRLQRWPPDLLIRPSMSANINMLVGYGRVFELVRAGMQATQEQLPVIAQLLKQEPS